MLLRKASLLMAVLLGVCLLVPDMADAGRRGGGSRSSAGRSRPSRSRTPSRSNTRSGSNRSSTASRKATKPNTRKATKADKALAAKAKKNGTSFKSKKEATAAFKKKNATKYKSKYASKPATRPSHIPASTSVGGRNVNVTYNVNHGGYGYMGAGGSWMMYNAMADAAMMGTLMRTQGYYAPGMNSGAVMVHSPGSGIFTFLLIIIGGVVIVGVVVTLIRQS